MIIETMIFLSLIADMYPRFGQGPTNGAHEFCPPDMFSFMDASYHHLRLTAVSGVSGWTTENEDVPFKTHSFTLYR